MNRPASLADFPRPPRDTGYGLHWYPGVSLLPKEALVGKWLPRLVELGTRWITFTDPREALALADPLRSAGLMPIVCLERPRPDVRLDTASLTLVDELIQAGVVYFELGRTPDDPRGWNGDELPADAPMRVARALAHDLEAVLERGGLPGLPATAPDTGWDLVGALLDLGHADLLNGPVWQAVHNRPANRPPDYPDDPVNLDGVPVTPTLYQTLAQEMWDGQAWQGRSREEVNRLRREQAHRGHPSGREPLGPHWHSYEALAQATMARLGRPLPMIATVTGYQVGASVDPRYPAVTPNLHMAFTLELCRMLMGTSRRYPATPPYLLAATFWLLAGSAFLGDEAATESALEAAAWFSPRWPEGHLPIAEALAEEPKLPRPLPADALADEVSSPPPITVRESRSSAQLATLHGHVRGGAGATLYLVRSDGLLLRTLARADGTYRFVDLEPGIYTVWVHRPEGNRQAGVELRAGEMARVDLRVDGWGYERPADEPADHASLHCQVELPVHALRGGMPALRLHAPGEPPRVVPMVRQSDRREAVCQIGPLSPGRYRLEVIGLTDPYSGETLSTPLPAEVTIRPRATAHLRFVFSPPSPRPPRRSTLVVQVRPEQPGHKVVLMDEHDRVQEAESDEEGAAAFTDLPPGRYAVHLADAPTVGRPRFGLDGENTAAVTLALPPAMQPPSPTPTGEIVCRVEDPEIRRVSLLREDGIAWIQRADDGLVVFPRLRPGDYTLAAAPYLQPGLHLAAGERIHVILPARGPVWTVATYVAAIDHGDENRGGEETAELVVEIPGRPGWPVKVYGPNGLVREGVLGEANGALWQWRLTGLPPGSYRVEAEGIATAGQVHLDPGRRVYLLFRRLLSPPPPQVQTSPLM